MPQQNHTIMITAVSGSTLTLSDNGQTTVNAGDSVTWIVQGNVGITLTSISADQGSSDIFDPNTEPTQLPNGSIKGTVASNANGLTENYTIHWQSNSNGRYYSMDPTLRVNN